MEYAKAEFIFFPLCPLRSTEKQAFGYLAVVYICLHASITKLKGQNQSLALAHKTLKHSSLDIYRKDYPSSVLTY